MDIGGRVYYGCTSCTGPGVLRTTVGTVPSRVGLIGPYTFTVSAGGSVSVSGSASVSFAPAVTSTFVTGTTSLVRGPLGKSVVLSSMVNVCCVGGITIVAVPGTSSTVVSLLVVVIGIVITDVDSDHCHLASVVSHMLDNSLSLDKAP